MVYPIIESLFLGRLDKCSTNAVSYTHLDVYKRQQVYILPKHLDEKVAKLHLSHIGVKLETLDEEQAAYIGVTVEGPFKSELYRY